MISSSVARAARGRLFLSSLSTRLSERQGARARHSLSVARAAALPCCPAAVRLLSSTTEDAAPDATPEPPKETLEFQAETRQLLDIVTHSLYTDKEVFLRELISNASDALEKLRHIQSANTAEVVSSDLPLEIRIELDEVTSSITISDSGVGMTRDEMVSNLGTIARSGSKNFVQELQRMSDTSEAALDPARGIIGKFGVGFYSAFMVSEKVEVISRSALKEHEAQPTKVWSSDGTGTFDLRDLEEGVRQGRGSSIKLFLKSDYWNLIDEKRIEGILQRYSNFVGFPIYVNGNRVNTIDAIWTRDPKEVDEDEYSAFYKYIANAIDDPLDVCHFRADAPLEIKALFFTPSFHSEKYGMGRMEPGVSLYSRKVLIESKSPDILPDWLRFVKGVVDSEDLPLSISREKAQDSSLIAKLKKALTRKFISHLTKMRKTDKDKYINEFYKEFSYFLKEGICQDFEFQAPLAKLLYFETSKASEKDIISLDDYVGKMRPEQKDIYYVLAPSRAAALNSPYLEAFEKAGVEVIFLFSEIDDFVMGNLENYEGRKLVSVEKGDIDLSELTSDEAKDEHDKIYEADRELSVEESIKFCNWFRKELGETKVASCTVTKRLSTSPAIVTDNESGAMRRLMRMVDTTEGNRDGMPLPKQQVEINPKHPVIVGIYDMIEKEPTLARVVAEQVFDNCLVAAGLLDDSRSMLPRLNDILICVVKGAADAESKTKEAAAEEAPVEEAATEEETPKDEEKPKETKE
jgi:TNF receptor-associated protein 1